MFNKDQLLLLEKSVRTNINTVDKEIIQILLKLESDKKSSHLKDMVQINEDKKNKLHALLKDINATLNKL